MKLTDLAESGMSESDGRCIVAPTADFVAPFPSKAAPQRASFGDEVGQRVAELETCVTESARDGIGNERA